MRSQGKDGGAELGGTGLGLREGRQEERAMLVEGREGGEKGRSPGESREQQKGRGGHVETLTVRKDQPGMGAQA